MGSYGGVAVFLENVIFARAAGILGAVHEANE